MLVWARASARAGGANVYVAAGDSPAEAAQAVGTNDYVPQPRRALHLSPAL